MGLARKRLAAELWFSRSMAVRESRPQTPGGGLFLAIAADVLAASPADAWRQRPESLVAHGTSRGP